MTNSNDSRDLMLPTRLALAARHPSDPWHWTLAHRRIRGRLIGMPPYMRDLMREDHPFTVIQKGAQVGLSEMCISIALHAAASGYAGRGHVLDLFPTAERAQEFSQARFGQAIAESPTISRLVGPTTELPRLPDNTHLRRVGVGLVYLRGAFDPRSMSGIDADLVILDEADEMPDTVIQAARQRIASSQRGRLLIVSTPRHPELGINELFRQSDQRYYHLPCPGCDELQRLTWEDNVDAERGIVCRVHRCRAPMDVMAVGEWIAEYPGNSAIRGYHLNRLYSPFATFSEMLRQADSPTIAGQMEFANSVLGEPYLLAGGGITPGELDLASADYPLGEPVTGKTYMGVDQGAVQHVVIRERRKGEHRLLFAGTVARISDLDRLIDEYHVRRVVIDAQPNIHEALDLIERHQDSAVEIFAAWYKRHDGRTEFDRRQSEVSMDRTVAIDQLYADLRAGKLPLPRQPRELGGRVKDGLGEYYRQLIAPKRLLTENAAGEPVFKYETRLDDHYAHAEVYCHAAASEWEMPDIDLSVNRKLYRPSQWRLST